MKRLIQMPGIITVLNTPFTASDRIDTEGIRKHVRYALDAGVAGFLVPAMASEVSSLSHAERLEVVEVVVSSASGRVPVIGGASAPDRHARVRAAKDLLHVGCAGVLASIPYESDEQYREDVFALAALDPGFLMLQDWDAAGDGLPLPLIVSLFEEVPKFRCLKIETAQAGLKYTRVIAATGGALHVSGGWAVTQMIEGLDRGVHAFMPTGLHYAYSRIFHLYAQGDRDAALGLFRRLAPILAFSNQYLDLSILFFKRLLHVQGVFETSNVRGPKTGLDCYQERIADELIALAISIESELANTPWTVPTRGSV